MQRDNNYKTIIVISDSEDEDPLRSSPHMRQSIVNLTSFPSGSKYASNEVDPIATPVATPSSSNGSSTSNGDVASRKRRVSPDGVCGSNNKSQKKIALKPLTLPMGNGLSQVASNSVIIEDNNQPSTSYSDTFKKFMKACCECDKTEDMTKILNKKTKPYYERAHKLYTQSKEFEEMLEGKIQSMLSNHMSVYAHIGELHNELKNRKVTTYMKGKSKRLDPGSSSADLAETEDIDIDNPDEERRWKKYLKLQAALQKCDKVIKKLESKEVDWDDNDDSTYIQLQKYRERCCKLYTEICKYTGERDKSRKPRVVCNTRYPKVNEGIEKFVLHQGTFPDFRDIYSVIEKCNKEESLLLSSGYLYALATDTFEKIGNQLQKHRQFHDWDVHCWYLGSEKDPADNDPELAAKLSENKEQGAKKLEEVLVSFTKKQEECKLEPVEVKDEEASASEKEESDEEDEDVGEGEEKAECASVEDGSRSPDALVNKLLKEESEDTFMDAILGEEAADTSMDAVLEEAADISMDAVLEEAADISMDAVLEEAADISMDAVLESEEVSKSVPTPLVDTDPPDLLASLGLKPLNCVENKAPTPNISGSDGENVELLDLENLITPSVIAKVVEMASVVAEGEVTVLTSPSPPLSGVSRLAAGECEEEVRKPTTEDFIEATAKSAETDNNVAPPSEVICVSDDARATELIASAVGYDVPDVVASVETTSKIASEVKSLSPVTNNSEVADKTSDTVGAVCFESDAIIADNLEPEESPTVEIVPLPTEVVPSPSSDTTTCDGFVVEEPTIDTSNSKPGTIPPVSIPSKVAPNTKSSDGEEFLSTIYPFDLEDIFTPQKEVPTKKLFLSGVNDDVLIVEQYIESKARPTVITPPVRRILEQPCLSKSTFVMDYRKISQNSSLTHLRQNSSPDKALQSAISVSALSIKKGNEVNRLKVERETRRSRTHSERQVLKKVNIVDTDIITID